MEKEESFIDRMIRVVWTETGSVVDTMQADWVMRALFTTGSLITAAATLFVVLIGWRLATGRELPIPVAMQQMVLVAAVTAVVGPTKMYIEWVMDQAQDMPVRIAALISTEIKDDADVPGALSATVKPIIELYGADLSGGDLIFGALATTALLLAAAFALVCAMSLLLISKVGLAVMTGIGPFVILGVMFQPTRPIFDKWLGYMITLLLTGVFVLLLLSVGAVVAKKVAATITGTGDIEAAQVVGGVAAMVVMGVMYAFVGSMASTIGGGIAVTAGAGLAMVPFLKAQAMGQSAGAAGKAAASAAAGAAGGAVLAKVGEKVADSSFGVRRAAARQMAGEAATAAAATRGSRVGEEVMQQRMKAASRAAEKERWMWRVQNS